MHDRKKYHREYMRRYRAKAKTSPEKQAKLHAWRRKYYRDVQRSDPEWINKERNRLKEAQRKYRGKNGIRAKQTAAHRCYINTDKGRASARRTRLKYEAANPERLGAWKATKQAMSKGRMLRLPCKVCGDENTHAHHPDVTRQLEVVFLCPLHHAQAHRQISA